MIKYEIIEIRKVIDSLYRQMGLMEKIANDSSFGKIQKLIAADEVKFLNDNVKRLQKITEIENKVSDVILGE